MDKDTQNVMTDGERLRLLCQHEGWDVARKKLIEKITQLQTTIGLKMTDPQQMFIEVQARTLAAEMLFDWFKNDIEGTAEQHINNASLSKKPDGYILRES